MKILKNQNLLERQSENLIRGELSNVAAVIQTPQVLTEYYSVDADSSTTVTGFKNIDDIIGPISPLVFNIVDNVPISGIDNLISQTQFDDETGYDEEFQSSGITFPNTILPKPYDIFTIKGDQNTAIYIVTGVTPVTVRSNPFTEISFRLLSRDKTQLAQLRKQIKDEYVTTVTSIGTDKTLVIKRETYFKMKKYVEDYIDLTNLYIKLFFDRTKGAFVLDGIYDEEKDRKDVFVDIPLWKFMFDNQIIAYDEVMTYANNNYNMNIDRIFIDCPEKYLTEFTYGCTPIVRIFDRNPKKPFDEYRYPQVYEEDARITKFTGVNMMYIEAYGKAKDCNPLCDQGPVFDDEFIERIKTGTRYEDNCEFNQIRVSLSLRNSIIDYYNNREIDWENISIGDEKTAENYFLIPLLLGIYKKFIMTLK